MVIYFIESGAEKETMEMIDQWKDGILSIGTLAIDPLAIDTIGMIEGLDEGYDQEITNDHHDHIIMDDDHDVDDHDESKPLMNVKFFSHELEKIMGANHEITEEEVVITKNDEEQSKRRVTLADLFMEDCDHYPVKVLKEILDDHNHGDDDDHVMEKQGSKDMMKPTSIAKNGLSKAKKLLKEDLHPLRKFSQVKSQQFLGFFN